MNTVTIKAEITRSGLPAIWECGGGMTSRGSSRIVTGPKGEKLKPLTLARRSNDNHALFIAREGQYVIQVQTWHDTVIEVYKIHKIHLEDEIIECKLESTFEKGCWDIEPKQFLEEAIKAAVSKSKAYHCREAYWSLPLEPRY